MTDDVIERVAVSLWRGEAERAHPNTAKRRTGNEFLNEAPEWREKWVGLSVAALSALRPGDVLPNGCVVVPDNDWAVVAQFSALSPAKKRAVFAFIEAAKEEG